MYINIMELCWLIASSTPDYTEAVVPGIESGISVDRQWTVYCKIRGAEREASP